MIRELVESMARRRPRVVLVASLLCLGCPDDDGGSTPPTGGPAIESFAAGASPIAPGSSTTLTATFSGGAGMIDQGVGAVTSGQSVTVSPLVSTTYTLTVHGDGGPDASRTATVEVTQAPGKFSISGHVAGISAQGVTIALSGDATGTVITGAGGGYAFADLDPGHYLITPSAANRSFEPPSAEVTIVAENHGGVSFEARLAGYEEFPVGAGPQEIVAAPDGALYFTESTANKIGRLTVTGQLTEYPIPTADSYPWGIAVYVPPQSVPPPAGAAVAFRIVFTEYSASKIGFLDPGTSEITEVPTARPAACPSGIAASGGPDAQDLIWIAQACEPQSTMSSIARMEGTSRTITEITLGTGGDRLTGIAVADDHGVWFAEPNQGKIGHYAGPGELLPECGLPATLGYPQRIALMGGAVYFTERDGNHIGAILAPDEYVCNPSPFTEWEIPTAQSAPAGITAGPGCTATSGQGIWFTEPAAGKIGCVLDGDFEEFSVPRSPEGITVGPDGNIWFTMPTSGRVGRIPPP